MKATGKTIEFVKGWIAGSRTKYQYQNYYTVSTKHAQFLMKKNENHELLAIRDLTGHIYLFDKLGYAEPTVLHSSTLSNPFHCLISDKYPFKYTIISPNTVSNADILDSLSKWKVLDRVEIENQTVSGGSVYLSLIDIADSRYVIDPIMNGDNKYSLSTWASYGIEKQYKFEDYWPLYSITPLFSNKVNSIREVRDSYVTMAGDALDQSWCNLYNWVFIPTKFNTIEEITGREFKTAKRTRPSPYSYGIDNGFINPYYAYLRFNTTNENANALKSCINIRGELTSSDWQDKIRENYLPESAHDMIAFFKADDEWLQEHYEIAQAGVLENKFKTADAKLILNKAIVYIHKEPNLSPLRDYVIYIKFYADLTEENYFKKVLPLPPLATHIREVLEC